MKRLFLVSLSLIFMFVYASAQIGYQVTVYDQVKKEPKANQTVTATVTITDNAGSQIASQTYTGTTDEFGILSMTVGNANLFDKVDWSKLPFWISATVDGITISKTQILNVPVAEYAKQTGSLTKDILCGKTWTQVMETTGETYTFSFYKNGTGKHTFIWPNYYPDGGTLTTISTFTYNINGDVVGCVYSNGGGFVGIYVPSNNQIMFLTYGHSFPTV